MGATFDTEANLHSVWVGPHAKHAYHIILERFELTVQKGGKERKLQAPGEHSDKNLQRCYIIIDTKKSTKLL